jgi:alkanesulfonate monooxygenase SsuD/methylene tetrahydromethanopterin reductase-like flavin-dependent oxidoreductase (luciferase family)
MTRLGFGLAVGTSRATVEGAAQACEAAGLSSFWLNHPPHQDGLAALGWAAPVTSRITLATGVIPLSARSVDSILDGLDEAAIPPQRYLLGIGSGSGAQPVQRVRAALTELRTKVSSPLVVGALGPRMCALGGREADGVLLNWTSPAHARQSAEIVHREAQEAGRNRPRIYAYVRVALGEAAQERLRSEAASYASIPQYQANFARARVAAIETAVAATTAQSLRQGLEAWAGVVDEVVVRAILGADAEAEATRLIEVVQGAF